MRNKFMENIEIDEPNNEAKLFVNTKFYPIDAILIASREFTKNFWALVDGDPESDIIVALKPKRGKTNLEKLAYEFMNHVLATLRERV